MCLPQIPVNQLMLVVGVLGINFGLARWMYKGSSVCFAVVLPLFLCLELGWWRSTRSWGLVRAFWSRFLFSSMAAWGLFLAIDGLIAFEEHDVRIAFLVLSKECKQLIAPQSGRRIEAEYPVLQMAILFSMQCSLGLWGAWFFGENSPPLLSSPDIPTELPPRLP